MIFTIEENTNSIETISESMNGTQEELLSILSESIKNIFQIRSEILKESVNVEERYIVEELTLNEASIILESSFSEKIEVAKAVLSDLKDKFIAWVTKMISNIKLFLSNYEGFIKKNKDKIESLKTSNKKVSIKIYDIKSPSKFIDDMLKEGRENIAEVCKLSKLAFTGNQDKIAELMQYIEENEILFIDSNEIIENDIKPMILKNEQPEEMIIPVDIIMEHLETTKSILKRFEKYKKDFEKAASEAIKSLSVEAVKNTSTLMNIQGGMECYSYALASVTVLLTHIPRIIFYLSETTKKVTLEYLRILKDALR